MSRAGGFVWQGCPLVIKPFRRDRKTEVAFVEMWPVAA